MEAEDLLPAPSPSELEQPQFESSFGFNHLIPQSRGSRRVIPSDLLGCI